MKCTRCSFITPYIHKASYKINHARYINHEKMFLHNSILLAVVQGPFRRWTMGSACGQRTSAWRLKRVKQHLDGGRWGGRCPSSPLESRWPLRLPILLCSLLLAMFWIRPCKAVLAPSSPAKYKFQINTLLTWTYLLICILEYVVS
jgi:hypothetical protein